MRTSRLGWFLAVPLLASVAPIGAQEGDPLKAEFSGSFSETRLSAVVNAVHEATKTNIIVDSSVDADALLVTTTATRQPLANFLTEVERQTNLAHTAWCGAIVLHPTGKAPAAEPRLPAAEGLDARLAMTFEATPFMFAVERLRTRTPLEIDVTPRARASVQQRGASLTLRVARMQLKHLLAHMARSADIVWTLEGRKVVFDAPGVEGRTVDAATIDQPRGDPLTAAAPTVDASKLLADLRTAGGREGARRQLIAAGKQVAQPVAAFIADPNLDPTTLSAALQVLARVGEAAHAEPVLAIFRDANRPLEVRNEAGLALAALKAPSSIGGLIDALDDTWFRIAETARAALVEIGEPAVAPLATRWQAAKDRPSGNDGLVYRGLLIFGSIGNDRCKQVLLDTLKTNAGPRAVPLRHHAAIGLGFTQDPKVIEPMIEALERERQFLVASYIARSLSWITDQTLPPQPARWRAWWAQNKEKILTPNTDDLYDPVEVPQFDLPTDPNKPSNPPNTPPR
jgi:hypothetical protein